jgi:radical SAM protein with 4Fe4S-binding SPASM domain
MKFYKVNIEISNICNLQCTFCPEVIRPKALMDTELFRRVIDQVAPYTKVVTLHLMGEPLLHPKLAEIVEICAARGVQIFLVTNGLLLKGKIPDLLLHPVFRQINFSLHSYPDNFGEKDPTDYLNAVFNFSQRAFEARPRLFINYRLWNLQASLGSQPKNLGLLRKIEDRFQVSVPRNLNLHEKKNFQLKGQLYLHFDHEFSWPAMNAEWLGESGTCYGLTSHIGVLVDGTVVPCCLDKEGEIPLGNLKETPLKEILQSTRARAMREGFREHRLVEPLCQRCQYIERFQENLAVSQAK